MCYVLIYTLQGLKADVVYFMDMSQHKMLALVKWTIWLDNYLTMAWKTTNHMNGYLITVCCSPENHMITPSATLFHVC